MCDELSQFDGCERLIVIAVGLDADVAQATHEKRSQLYRALTRAHLMVIVVNEFIQTAGSRITDLELRLADGQLDLRREQADAKITDDEPLTEAARERRAVLPGRK